MREVSGPPQQPSGVCGPGEIKGDSVRAVSGCTQVLLLEHSREGSGTEAGGAAAPKRVARRRQRSKANTSPKGASKHKKAWNTTEEDEADEEEVFGVPQAMAEEQRDALGMLTQTLAQLAEWMGALEAQERVEIEREWLELEHERLELERRCATMEER